MTVRQGSEAGELACPPLYGTARSYDRPTLGQWIAETAERLGKPLMPHQRYIVDVIGEIDPDTGTLAYSEVILIGPRQATGKTELLLPLMTYRCTGFGDALAKYSNEMFGHNVPTPGPQRVLYTAQSAEMARAKWRDVHVERLKHSYYGRKNMFTARLLKNHEQITWRNSSTWSPASTTAGGAGTGDTVDLPILDEAWSQKDFRTELGLRPTMMTRRWRQLWVTSMIPGISRAMPGTWPYLAKKREIGRVRVEAGVRKGMAFFDFGAPPDSDPGDPATWWKSLPGLGVTVTEQAVREDYDAMDLADFCAEYLGIAPSASAPRWTVVQKETWNRLYDPQSTIEGVAALSVEIAEDRSAAWIGVAGRRVDGHWHAAIAEPGYRIQAGVSGIEWLENRLLELIDELKPCTVAIDPRRPAASLIVPLRRRGIDVLTPNQRDIAGACGRFFDATGEVPDPERDDGIRVFHLGQREVARALAGARKYELGGGAFTFVGKGSTSVISPLYALVLAMHGHDVKSTETAPEADIFV